jgi:hypothetical protein
MRTMLGAFSKKHAHLLVFFGALIVFLTFIVKEGLHERWKEDADAIEMAQYVFEIKTDTAELLQARPDPLHPGTVREEIVKAVNRSNVEEGIDLVMRVNRQQENTAARIGAAKILANVLDSEDQDREYMTKLRLEANGIFQETTRLWNKAITIRTDKPMEYEEAQQFAKEAQANFDALYNLDGKLRSFQSRLYSNAENVKSRHRTYATWTFWISALLFFVGWSLGLLGKLYGVPEAAGSE